MVTDYTLLACTGEPRGFCVLSVDKTTKPLIFFKLNPNSINVKEVPCQGMQQFLDNWKSWLSTTPNTDDPNKVLEETVSVLLSYLKELPNECSLHTYQVDVRCCKNKEHVCWIDKLLNAIQKSDIYRSLLPLISKDDSDQLCSKLWSPSAESLTKHCSCDICDPSTSTVDAATVVAVFLYSWPYDSAAAKLSKFVADSCMKLEQIVQNEIASLRKQWLIVLDYY